jgi:hypothetical protein
MTEDETLLTQFEATTWPLKEWHHRQHIKIAYLYLRQHPFEVAAQKMRAGLLAYNAANQVPDGLDRGYHETMTQVWMRLVYLTICEFGPSESADAFVDKHTQLLSKRAALFFYSRDRIMSAEAKRQFIEPDLAPLPQSAKNGNPPTGPIDT